MILGMDGVSGGVPQVGVMQKDIREYYYSGGTWFFCEVLNLVI